MSNDPSSQPDAAASPPTGADDIAGALRVRLDLDGSHVCHVAVKSTRPADAARVFHGRNPAEAARMMGLVFSLCARAQTVCALQSLEQAMGVTVHPAQQSAREVMRLAEMLSQTAMRLCLDWPRLLGVGPRADVVRGCFAAEKTLEAALFNATPWQTPGGVDFQPDVAALGAQAGDLAAMLGDAVLTGLAQDLRHGLAANGLEAFGACPPSKTERAIEDGALSRRWDAPAVRDAREQFGAGLKARLEARLVDLTQLNAELMAAIETMGEQHDQRIPASAPPARATGNGRARVETVRGGLTHRVELQDGVIGTYSITAPTDANFAPGGAVAAGLMGADGVDPDALTRAAELHVLAIDPCVACSIEIGSADGTGGSLHA